MTRTVCLRSLATAAMILTGMLDGVVCVGQTEPAPAPKSNDPSAGATAPMTTTSATRGAQTPAQALQTPAQQKYGLPRNPIVGGPVDIDLSKPLALDRAVRIGLQRQDAIGIARAQRDVSSNQLTIARSSYFPQITPSLQYQSSLSPVSGFSGSGTGVSTGRATNSFVSETRTDLVGVSQLIFDTGKREASVGQARRNLFASEFNLANERQNVILNVTTAYYTLLRDQELVKVQQLNVNLAQTTLDIIQAQVKVGNAAQSDTLQAEADLANARVSLLQAQNDARTAEASLKNTMGVASSQPLTLDANVMPPDPTPDPRGIDSYVSTAYNVRSDLKQQQELINAQGYSVRIAQINNGVTVNATVNEGYQFDPVSGEERTFAVAFSYPLFDGGSTRAAVKENKALLEEQRRQLDQDQQNVRLNVEQDYLTREVSRQQVTAAQAAERAGEENNAAASAKLKNGLINILDALNAQVQLVTAQANRVNAVYNFYIADARLIRDIGLNDPDYVPNVPRVRVKRSPNSTPPAGKTGAAAPAPQPIAASVRSNAASAPSTGQAVKEP